MTKTNAFCLLTAIFFSCNSTKKVASKITATQETTADKAAADAMLRGGTTFFGEGSSPVNWQLQIDYDDTVRFSADDGLSLKVAYNKLRKNIQPAQSDFSANIEGGNLDIIVNDDQCIIPTHREVYPKSVTVTFNGRAYTGCGKYLADQTLNNKWLLDQIGHTAVNPDEYERRPFLQFDLDKAQVSGSDGCNSLSGKMEVQGNRIQFAQLTATKVSCRKKNIGTIISTLVSGRLVNYFFRSGELYLYLPDDSVLIFKKA